MFKNRKRLHNIRIKKAVYFRPTNTTTIYFKGINLKGLWEEDFKVFNGKISFKGKRPTEEEVFNFIEMKGGLNI